ncbi:MAG: hypothetical protein WBM83_00635 [Flavobacteriaceae bacterium]
METSPGIKQTLLIEHKLDIGKFMFYTNVVVGEFYEGVHVTKENAIEPIKLSQQIYGSTKPIVYVSHRLNSYSMDPVGYAEVVKMFPNFIGFAIVSHNKYRRMLASLEKLFIKKPVSVFHDMADAFLWAENQLDKNLSDLD